MARASLYFLKASYTLRTLEKACFQITPPGVHAWAIVRMKTNEKRCCIHNCLVRPRAKPMDIEISILRAVDTYKANAPVPLLNLCLGSAGLLFPWRLLHLNCDHVELDPVEFAPMSRAAALNCAVLPILTICEVQKALR